MLEYCSVDDLNGREFYWINYYKSNTDGYNIRLNPNSNRGLQWSEKQPESMMAVINKEGSYFKNHTVPRETLGKHGRRQGTKFGQKRNENDILSV